MDREVIARNRVRAEHTGTLSSTAECVRSSSKPQEHRHDPHGVEESNGPGRPEHGQSAIAIIGMGCLLPGSIASPSDMWEFLRHGRSGYCAVPASRFNGDAFYHPNPGVSGATSSTGGFFINQDVRLFDNAFFGLNNLETLYTDPQQRKLLEVVFQCIEDAGIPKDTLSGANVGCFVANFTYDFQVMQLRDPESLHRYSATGLSTSILANRVSYAFNLKGPSVVFDTACSSSLYALHAACQALNAGDCDAAIVAGANLILSPELHTGVAKAGMLSGTSISHTFDESADGYGRGEGVAALYLKRVSHAVRDHDSIRSVIRGTAVNSNGRTNGITLPSISGQECVIQKAYARAGLQPSQACYVEAHGTGTQVGDPIETEAISKVFGKRQDPVLIGSIKPNLGHGEGVSGLTSIIKATLILENSLIPATIGIEKINPKIKADEWNLEIVQTLTPLPHRYPSIVSVNSFGFGGANGHVILESAQSHQTSTSERDRPWPLGRNIVLPFSAYDPAALKQRVSQLTPETLSRKNIARLLHHLAKHRTAFSTRGYIDVSDAQIGLALDGSKVVSNEHSQPQAKKLALVFCGQGSQWPGMGAGLIQNHLQYRMVIKSLDISLRLLDDAPAWCMEDILSGQQSSVHQATVSQALITATQIALIDVLRAWGVKADAAVGHSSGEIAAAYAAGYLTATEAMHIAYYRGMLVSQITRKGAMAAVGTSSDGAKELIAQSGFQAQLSVAAVNSPASVTVSGNYDALDAFVALVESRSIFVRKLQTGDVAYHSAHMESAATSYTEALEKLFSEPDPPQADSELLVVSSVTGKPTSRFQMRQPAYWSTNLRCPVEFAAAAACLFTSDEYNTIEIGPHPVLKTSLKQIKDGLDATSTNTLRLETLVRHRNGVDTLHRLAGELFIHGYDLDFESVNQIAEQDTQPRPMHDLPSYPWQHRGPVMSESRLSSEYRNRCFPRHDLLGSRIPGTDGIISIWRSIIDLGQLPWLNDHKVGSDILFPAAGHLALAIEAKRQLHDITDIQFRDVNVFRALFISESDKDVEIFTTLRPVEMNSTESSPNWHHFQVTSYLNGRSTVHANGMIGEETTPRQPFYHLQTSHALIQPDCIKTWYDKLLSKGFAYGPALQGIQSISRAYTPDAAFIIATASWIREADTHLQKQSGYLIHPTCLDLMLQAGIISSAHVFRGGLRRVIPRHIQNISISSACSRYQSESCEIRADSDQTGPNVVKMNSQLTTHGDEVLAQFKGIRTIPFPVTLNDIEPKRRNPLLRVVWKPDISKVAEQDSEQLTRYVTHLSRSLPQSVMWTANRNIMAMLDLIVHHDPTKRILVLGEDKSTAGLLELLGMSSYTQRARCCVQVKLDEFGSLVFHSIPSKGPDEEPKTLVQMEDDQRFDLILLLQASPSALGCKSNDSQTTMGLNLSAMHTYQIRKLLTDDALILQCEEHAGISIELRGGNPSTIVTVAEDSSSEASLRRLTVSTKQKVTDKYSQIFLVSFSRLDRIILTDAVKLTKERDDEVPPGVVSHLVEVFGVSVQTMALLDLSRDSILEKTLVVSLLEFGSPLLNAISEIQFQKLKLCLKPTTTMVWLVSGGSFTVQQPDSSLVLGLSRSLSLEIPSLEFVVLSIEARDIRLPSLPRHVIAALENAQHQESDREYFLHDGLLHISRFVPEEKMNQHFRECQNIEDSLVTCRDAARFQLSMRVPNQLDSLNFVQVDEPTVALPKDHVEIKVCFAGLNAKDVHVLTARVDTPDATCSLELSGVIVAAGSDVTSFKIGDRVVSMAPNHFASYTRVPEWSCAPLHAHEDLATAATIPIVYSTVIYALENRANLQCGESILIHSGASAVGMAAIQFALHKGATVFTTVSTEEKRKFLVNVLGYSKMQILLLNGFADIVRELTDHRGVDVVLNSRTGEHLKESWQICADFGRFIDIGKKHFTDGTRLEMDMFKHDVTFTALDITNQYQSSDLKQQASWNRLLHQSLEFWRSGMIKILKPVEVYSVSDVAAAFKTQARRSHIGKLAVSFQNSDALIKLVPTSHKSKFDPRKVYLMIGCLGGLGRCLARWMFKYGARKFAFMGRSGASTNSALGLVSELCDGGAQVDVFKGSVTDKDFVDTMVGQIAEPIGGVFLSAMVVEAMLFSDMSAKSWHASLAPKVQGAWNIHNALKSRNDTIEHFVLLSSISGSVGSPAESNYCAANSFLDAFAKYRRSLGLPGISLGLGMISEAGYLHENVEVQAKLLRRGIQALTSDEFLQVVDLALTDEVSSCVAPGNAYFAEAHLLTGLEMQGLGRHAQNIHASDSYLMRDPRMKLLVQSRVQDETSHGDRGLVPGSKDRRPKSVATALAAHHSTPPTEVEALKNSRQKLLKAVQEEVICEMASLLIMQADKLGPDTQLVDFGIDSMLGAEFRTFIYNALGVDVTFASLMDTSTTVGSISALVAEGLIAK